MSAYAVDIQPGTGFEFKNQTFTVNVDAEGFDSAARRGIRRAVDRAEEWNAEHPDEVTPRLADRNAYRVVAVRALDVDLVGAAAPAPATAVAAHPAGPQAATLIVAMDVSTVLAALHQQHGH
ncbi:hypothetical protein [Prescottella subtropica]|uniref:hypothetical protein n=1 Tax=Prescottella subtropica TaxID=2545757 RepID=UPI0010F66EF0|nr:hypothetical protein [Prescottella subtropica]